MAAAAGLDGGLLVGGDHIIVARPTVCRPSAVVEVEHPLRLGGEVGVGDEDPRLVLPGFERVLGQPPAHRRRRDRRRRSRRSTPWRPAPGTTTATAAAPCPGGGVQAIALTRATCTAVNFGRRPDRFASASDATPGAAHQRRRHLRTVSSHDPQPPGDLRVRLSRRGREHDLRPASRAVARCARPGSTGSVLGVVNRST